MCLKTHSFFFLRERNRKGNIQKLKKVSRVFFTFCRPHVTFLRYISDNTADNSSDDVRYSKMELLFIHKNTFRYVK